MPRAPKYVFFDTETTGLVNFKQDADHHSQPFLVQLAAILTDEEVTPLTTLNVIVDPANRYKEMPQRSFEAHGISMEKARDEGIDLVSALTLFNYVANQASVFICHNIAFDEKMMEAEFLRVDDVLLLPDRKFCTMQSTTDFVRAPPFRYGSYKWPNLQELHTKLFGEGFEGAHDALTDITITMKCFKELKRLKVPGINIP